MRERKVIGILGQVGIEDGGLKVPCNLRSWWRCQAGSWIYDPGLKTEVGAQNISFENCLCKDVGVFLLVEITYGENVEKRVQD